MSGALRKPLTLETFLAWERTQELRYEFDGVQPIAMTGGSLAHSMIATNIAIALDRRLRSGCRAFRGDVKVIVAGRVRYPDVAVTCSPLDASSDIVPAPVVLFEVLSPSTENVDRTVKMAEYFSTPSIQHYGLVAQRAAFVEVWSREPNRWDEREINGMAADIKLTAIGVDLPMTEIYRDVFPAAALS